MNALALFPPDLAQAHRRIAAVNPARYARTRNALDGAVSQLSPYITHGFVSLPQVLAGVASRHRLDVQHKFVYELGWREYFRHVWRHQGDATLCPLHEGPLPRQAYAREVSADVREARTGVPVIDQAVRTLYATAYLHNHARMWLASYLVHLRKVDWRAGADWMHAHLLDGDLASNHLSWQWVAGTGSHKPYLFNADNVARHAPPPWHSPGSVIDTSYEALEAIARGPGAVQPGPWPDAGPLAPGATPAGPVEEPALSTRPARATLPDATLVGGRDVWLVHPWALGEPPADLDDRVLRMGWWPREYHDAWPWSLARWQFVETRMAELTTLQWHGSRDQLAQALATARSAQTLGDPHVDRWLPIDVSIRRQARLFPEVETPCASFSAWWTRCTRGLREITDLPGIRELQSHASAGPLWDAATPHGARGTSASPA